MDEYPNIHITEAAPDDAPLVYAIMQAAFAEYLGVLNPPSGVHDETLEDTAKAIREGGAILAWLADKAVGSARYLCHQDYFYVGRVSVLPGYRGHGVASAMMNYLEGVARANNYPMIELTVRMVLESNINLYKRLGYEIIEVFEHPKGGSMVVNMSKQL